MQNINVYSALRQMAEKAKDNKGCSAIEEVAVDFMSCFQGSTCYGSEFAMGIEGNGTFSFQLFKHEDSSDQVTIEIWPDGDVVVRRQRDKNGIHDYRVVRF